MGGGKDGAGDRLGLGGVDVPRAGFVHAAGTAAEEVRAGEDARGARALNASVAGGEPLECRDMPVCGVAVAIAEGAASVAVGGAGVTLVSPWGSMLLPYARRNHRITSRYRLRESNSFGDGPIRVHARAHTRTISAIDQKLGTFDMDIQLGFEWYDPKLIKATTAEEWQKAAQVQGWNTQMMQTAWHPGITLQNLLRVQKETEVWYSTKNDFVTLNCRIVGTFSNRFKLHDFPFDFQFLAVRLSSAFDVSQVIFVKNAERQGKAPDLMKLRGFLFEEWVLQPYVYVRSQASDPCDSNTGTSYAELRIEAMVRRRPEFHLLQVVVISFSLVAIALCLFTTLVENPTDRVDWMVTLLLTGVAFKLVVADKLPPTAYLTMLHKYMECGFCVLFVVLRIRSTGSQRSEPASCLADNCLRRCHLPLQCCLPPLLSTRLH